MHYFYPLSLTVLAAEVAYLYLQARTSCFYPEEMFKVAIWEKLAVWSSWILYMTCVRARTFDEHIVPKNSTFEHTKPLFINNELKIMSPWKSILSDYLAGRVLHAFCSKEGPMPPWLRQGGAFPNQGGHTIFFKVCYVFCYISILY